MNIICEFGCNWKDNHTFKEMIKECQKIGIEYVKMQLWREGQVPYEVRGMYISLEKAHYFHRFAKTKGIELFFTPFYQSAINITELIPVKYYKIRLNDCRNYQLYNAINKLDKRVFVSCQHPLDTVWRNSHNATFFYCVPEYPAKYENYIGVDKNIFDGISDHTPDLRLLEECKKLGATWFEKHVCLDKNCYEARWSVPIKELEGLV